MQPSVGQPNALQNSPQLTQARPQQQPHHASGPQSSSRLAVMPQALPHTRPAAHPSTMQRSAVQNTARYTPPRPLPRHIPAVQMSDPPAIAHMLVPAQQPKPAQDATQREQSRVQPVYDTGPQNASTPINAPPRLFQIQHSTASQAAAQPTTAQSSLPPAQSLGSTPRPAVNVTTTWPTQPQPVPSSHGPVPLTSAQPAAVHPAQQARPPLHAHTPMTVASVQQVPAIRPVTLSAARPGMQPAPLGAPALDHMQPVGQMTKQEATSSQAPAAMSALVSTTANWQGIPPSRLSLVILRYHTAATNLWVEQHVCITRCELVNFIVLHLTVWWWQAKSCFLGKWWLGMCCHCFQRFLRQLIKNWVMSVTRCLLSIQTHVSSGTHVTAAPTPLIASMALPIVARNPCFFWLMFL